MTNSVAYKRWTLDALSFTAITVPISCDYVVLLNEDDTIAITLRSDPADSATEKSLVPGMQEYYQGTGRLYRFSNGATAIYAKANSATAILHASYLL